MKAIILAAGRGMRLNEGRSAIPKSMEMIGDKSIIHHQITQCQKLGIEKFVVVVGYEKVMLTEHVFKAIPKDRVHFIENTIFEQSNTLYSLYLARQYFSEDFLYFNADVFFHPHLLKKIVNDNGQSELLIEKKPVGEEEVKVRVENNCIVEIHKKIDPEKALGEFIGVAKFAQKDLQMFAEALEQGVYNGEVNNYFEYAVNMMAPYTNLNPVYTDGLECIEIDFQEDLKKAREIIYPAVEPYL